MRIATFNCNSVRVRLPIIIEWINKYQPDVLALQETKVEDKSFPKNEIESLGYNVNYRGEKSYNGVAAITKKIPEFVSFGLQDNDDNVSDTRMIHVKVQGVEIINTYVPQGQEIDSEKFQFKLKWMERLNKYIKNKFNPEKDKVIWTGDLNVAPLKIDVYDSKAIWPHVCHCQEIIDAFNNVKNWGFVDIFRKYLPDEGNYTFWDYRQKSALERNRGWRIDHILASKCFADNAIDCKVDVEPRKMERPSDHTFLYADFK